MGYCEHITATKYPKQYTENIGRPVKLIFGYDADHEVDAVFIRDDAEEPYQTIFKTNDGHIIRSAECQWRELTDAEIAEMKKKNSPQLKTGDRVRISGDAAELWIPRYNVRVDSEATVMETPRPSNKKVLVTIDSIDHDSNVTVYVRKSGLRRV